MKKLLLLVFVMAAGLTACQTKKDSVRSTVTGTGLAGAVNSTYVVNQCAQGVSNIGAIYDSSGGTAFETRVKSLLSATMYHEDIGTVGATVSDTTGVRFTGTMFLDASGNVVASKSKVLISVYDSIWYQNSITNASEQPIPLEFDPTKGATISGQFSPTTGQGYLLLKDQYGEVRFTGSYTSTYFSGTVTYTNTANVTGAAAASGTLGQFMINSCGIVSK